MVSAELRSTAGNPADVKASNEIPEPRNTALTVVVNRLPIELQSQAAAGSAAMFAHAIGRRASELTLHLHGMLMHQYREI